MSDRPNGLGTGTPIPTSSRLENPGGESEDWGNHNLSTTDQGVSPALADHVAVTNHGRGISSEHLANFVSCFADHAAGRIMSVGRLHYELGDTGEQHFESLTAAQVCDELLDELLDTVAYASMIAVKVLALRNGLQEGA